MFCADGNWRKYTERNFRTSYRQNKAGWTANLTDEELEIINNEIEVFYLNGDRIENAPTPVKVDVRKRVVGYRSVIGTKVTNILQIQTDAAFSDVYDTLINPLAADMPSSVFVYKFLYEGDIPTMKEKIAEVFSEKVSGR